MLKIRLPLLVSLLVNILFVLDTGSLVLKHGGLSFLLPGDPSGLGSAYFRERRDLFASMPRHPGAIVFLGDSLTERCPWPELLGRADVLNRGLGGEALGSILGRLDEALRHRPRQLFVMAGINDLIQGRSPAQVVADHRKLVARTRQASPRTMIYLESVLPVNRINFANLLPVAAAEREQSINASILEINRALAKMADGKRVFYLNIHDRVLDKSGQLGLAYTVDGLHLKGKGYAQWARIVTPLLQPKLPSPAPAR